MKVVAVELCFENLESVKFRIEDVAFMYFGEMTRQISLFSHNYVMEMEIAHDFRLHVNARGNTEEAYESAWRDEEQILPFTRVDMYPDITSVGLHMEDGTKREIYVDWREGSHNYCDNANQTSVVSEANGDLFVLVKEDEDVHEAFNGINDEDPLYRKIVEIKEDSE